jgi:hypothetical protein
MVPKSIAYSLLATALLTTGCTTGTTVVDAGEPASPAVFEETVTTEAPEVPAYDIRPFPTDSLYNLLVAEFAGLRNDINTSLKLYLQEARNTRDPGVVNRAIRIANYSHRADSVVEMAQLWADMMIDNHHRHPMKSKEIPYFNNNIIELVQRSTNSGNHGYNMQQLYISRIRLV